MTDGNPLITTLDGECSPQTRLHAEIEHAAVRILLPPALAEAAVISRIPESIGENANV